MLTLGVQSVDLTLLKTNTEGLARLAKVFACLGNEYQTVGLRRS